MSSKPRDALDITDDINRKLAQARAISTLMSLTASTREAIPDDSLPCAAWAVRDLLKQAGVLVGELLAKVEQPAQEVAA